MYACVCACVRVHVNAGACTEARGVRSPGAGCELSLGAGKRTPVLCKQHVLSTAEPSLQPSVLRNALTYPYVALCSQA